VNPLHELRRFGEGPGIPMENFVTISGCSSGGKSTLLAELRRRGFATIEEPGRRIVAEELKRGGGALPWIDAVAFARRVIEVSLADRAIADAPAPWVFFDRGLIDAASALEHLTGQPAIESLGRVFRYNKRVFVAPPWPEIYTLDQERRHDFAEAVAESPDRRLSGSGVRHPRAAQSERGRTSRLDSRLAGELMVVSPDYSAHVGGCGLRY
jgi:predicted ATPase